ncbi:MAG TPA: 3-hydroxyacyl-CoA dehydrogenase NAD-binding domain-containing protein [Polyangiaceae bacterium]|nr:3-hydroxyacyl-CoA dehydrogenase NAD-binding domain-containing protein [Polyangiaceae bacterium]
MAERIQTAGVIGAGVMGSAIAAHFAGAGIRTHLLDIVPPNLKPEESESPKARNRFADGGLERALKAKPALFFTPDAARLVLTGNLDDHLERLRECDLIVEAVVEDLEIKRKLFEKIAPFVQSNAILASNTSGLSIARMSEVLPPQLKSRFLVLHFFNPVRYMRLLEVAKAPETDPAVMERMTEFGEFLGKGVIDAKDTPNFVANRIGVYSMMLTMHQMLEAGLSLSAVDKITGKPMGRPSSAAFGTGDLVGIDTLVHVAKNCLDSLTQDEARSTFEVPEFVRDLVAAGRLGRKTSAGFYKKTASELLVYDVKSKDYRSQEKVRFDSLGAIKNEEDPKKRLLKLVNAPDAAGKFAWAVLSRTLVYSARRLGEIADDIVSIDRAMRWGFNWDLGPFEAWDAIGVPESVARMKQEGLSVPEWVLHMLESGRASFYAGGPAAPTFYDARAKAVRAIVSDAKQISLPGLKSEPTRLVKKNHGASLVDLGDGVLCVEFHTKLNTLDNDVIAMLGEAASVAEQNFQALVIGNSGEHFCAGANLMLIAMAAQQKAWSQIEGVVTSLQNAMQRLRYAKVPVVAAPFQYTLGGGAEVAMAADACQAHAETYMGLVEVGVGLVPAGGGCLRMVERYTSELAGVSGVDLLPFIGQASLNIAMAKVATSAEEAKSLKYLRQSDGISLNPARLLFEAKQRALGLARSGYRPPLPPLLPAAGYDAEKTIGARIWAMVEGGFASAHDALIANKVARILCGGPVAAGTLLPEQHFLDLEREAFLSLCGETKSQERVQFMLMNNKPLRN